VKGKADAFGLDTGREIMRSERILSPSDFGFNNILKREDGTLVYLDFEYFGWDDPAKLVADFYLQPEVPLPLRYREIFLEGALGNFGVASTWAKRLPLVYLLLSIKWCLIMLNIFRRFQLDTASYSQECLKQLEKSRLALQRSKKELEMRTFPLSLLKESKP